VRVLIDKRAAGLNSWVFLGFDLRQIPSVWLEGWRGALRWPVFSWIYAAPPVDVFLVDGSEMRYVEPDWRPCEPPGAKAERPAAFKAFLLPEDVVLHRFVSLPVMQSEDLKRLLSFEVDGATPFPREQTIWGYRIVSQAQNKQRIELVITARGQIHRALGERNTRAPTQQLQLDALEIWTLGDQSQPVALMGFSESRRQKFIRRQLVQMAAMLLLVPILTIAIAGVPMVEAELRLTHAQQDMSRVLAQSNSIDSKRSQLMVQGQSAQILLTYLKTLPQPLAILDLLSAKIPDTAYLERFDMNAQRILITGQADNAASLMQLLGATPGIENVRAPAAITRNPVNNKERFTLEFSVQPGLTP
jgi:general secretion pathway protein L